jgi:hypothetical protein
VSAAAPLASVIFGTVLVYLIHGENHGIQTVSKSMNRNTSIIKSHCAIVREEYI